jgi:hypothetical protein
METECQFTKEEIDKIITTDPSQINIIDTFLISHRNTIVAHDPIDYVTVFIEKLLKVRTYGAYNEKLQFFVGYTYSPMNAGIDLMENLGLNYVYLLYMYEDVKHARYDLYRVAKKFALHSNCVNHLLEQRTCHHGRNKIKQPTYYMYLATNHLFIYFPKFNPTTRKRIGIPAMRNYIMSEKKNIEKNRTHYTI